MKHSLAVVPILLFLCNFAHCADELSRTRVFLNPPDPTAGLPIPFKSQNFQPKNPEDILYVQYLRTTPLLPDKRICDLYLNETLKHLRPSDVLSGEWYAKRDDLGSNEPESVKLIAEKWVTIPYMAWGGNAGGGAVVGPLNRLFTLTESHITIEDVKGSQKPLTLTCFVKYAERLESDVWPNGRLKYGAYLSTGHRQYLSGPDKIFGFGLPDPTSEWDKTIRYYQ